MKFYFEFDCLDGFYKFLCPQLKTRWFFVPPTEKSFQRLWTEYDRMQTCRWKDWLLSKEGWLESDSENVYMLGRRDWATGNNQVRLSDQEMLTYLHIAKMVMNKLLPPLAAHTSASGWAFGRHCAL